MSLYPMSDERVSVVVDEAGGEIGAILAPGSLRRLREWAQALPEAPQAAAAPAAYDREVLVDVLVHHSRATIRACRCGWERLGASHPEHVADVYEAAVAARTEVTR